MLKLHPKNIVGSSKKNVWVQTRSLNYEDGAMLGLVLKLNCEDDDSLVDLNVVGSEVIAIFEQKAKHVEEKNRFVTMIKSAFEGVADGIEIECVVALIKNEKLFVQKRGGGQCYLRRSGRIAKISKDGDEVVMGTIKDKDVILLATESFEQNLTVVKLSETFLLESDIAESFAPMIHLHGEPYGVGAIVVEVKSEEEEVYSEQPSPLWKPSSFAMPKISLRNEMPRKLNMYIGGGLLLLLGVMVLVGMVRKVKIDEQKKYDAMQVVVSAKLAETVSIGDLNPERAKILLDESKREVENYLSEKHKDDYRSKANELLVEISKAEEVAFRKNDIGLNTLVELDVLSSGMQANFMKSDGKGNLIFADEQTGKVVLMNILDRSRQVFDNDGEKYRDLSVVDTKLYGLTNKTVDEINIKKSEAKTKIEADEFWLTPTKIGTFAGNVYILDSEQSEIWKYPTLGDEFGGRRRWLAAGITLDLSKVIDMKVVGDIWLLTSSGKLERYSRGAPVDFELVGFPANRVEGRFDQSVAMWVEEGAVYVLEAGASRIVVVGDDGVYKAQYVNSEFAQAKDLVVVDDKVYVLIGNVVKEFSL